MKLFSVVLVLFVIIGASLFHSSQRLGGELEELTSAIGSSYIASQDHLAKIQSSKVFSSRQRKLMKGIQSTAVALEEASSFDERIPLIQKIQTSSRVFIDSVEKDSPLYSKQEYREFARSMGEFGEVRKLLSEYNDIVNVWNNRGSSFVASFLQQETEELPLLRFDGTNPDIGDITI